MPFPQWHIHDGFIWFMLINKWFRKDSQAVTELDDFYWYEHWLNQYPLSLVGRAEGKQSTQQHTWYSQQGNDSCCLLVTLWTGQSLGSKRSLPGESQTSNLKCSSAPVRQRNLLLSQTQPGWPLYHQVSVGGTSEAWEHGLGTRAPVRWLWSVSYSWPFLILDRVLLPLSHFPHL